MTMEIQTFLNVHPGSLWLLQPLTVLLLLASARRGAAHLPKAVVSLEPPWINVLREDTVTLKCQGAHTPGNDYTQWFHNGSSITTQVQPSYSFKATHNDSGDYKCQTGQTSFSDPVHLDVVSDWLLLQTTSLVFQEGEPIHLRCHSWRSTPLYKVTFYQNGKDQTFSLRNSSFSISQAKLRHSGEYHCTGVIDKKRPSLWSQPVNITVQAHLPKAVVSLEPPWINVLREDTVTLKCQGAHTPGNDYTQWFHNGSSITTQVQPSYSFKATHNDSGDYKCQTGQTSFSDPVHLDVVSDWLLLQTTRLVFREGEPIHLRCHSWRSKPLYKVTFYQNGKHQTFSHLNSSFSIRQAKLSHSGEYHCTGVIGEMLQASQHVNITVQASARGGAAHLPKAVVSLEPPWINVLREDTVTLKCQGAHTPGNDYTQWFHNGSSITTQVQPSYSFKATHNDSGDYKCQTGQTSLSDPVHLDVVSDWLLLQTTRLVFREGEPIHLRCHGWRSTPLYKVTFYQNGKDQTFSHLNSSFSIRQAKLSHSGEYHCTGVIGEMLHASQPVNITVQANLPKAVVSLEPPWINVLREDTVTLKCQGAHAPGNDYTQWFHNGSSITTQVQPSYSFKARNNDSGDYRCQTGQTSLSDPVHLDVISDWVLLQTPHLVFQEGEPILLRCHGWRSKPLYKVTFFQNGKSKKFSHLNSSFSIRQANLSHSGEYHCTGVIGQMLHTSQPVNITVQGPGDSSLVVIIVSVVAVITAVAIGAAAIGWFRLRKKQISALSGTPEHRDMGETLPEEPANFTDAEEANKTEAENTITYSLLLHPEALEEETEPPDYQNI
ncbi:Fc receptor-like protein 5 isoform X3 [Diceros bicornis minor]|uniref:Fc receptor-like protein 5 isoform X3 n=1 Tax=Diceros bicornis minor TaxID=77932 RepID=UPI0026F177D5|nr:Fc receptor-like protein 5 isoform X3 [Diceros bicornis minor]